MPGIVRQSDMCSGHDCFPPRMPVSFSPDVFVNNQAVERNGDILASHCCPDHGCHSGVYLGGSNVYANNQSIQKQGDPISCGSICVGCSSDVFIG